MYRAGLVFVYYTTTLHLRQLLYKLYYTAAAEQHIIIKQRRGDGKLSSEFHTYLNWSRTEEILEMTEGEHELACQNITASITGKNRIRRTRVRQQLSRRNL